MTPSDPRRFARKAQIYRPKVLPMKVSRLAAVLGLVIVVGGIGLGFARRNQGPSSGSYQIEVGSMLAGASVSQQAATFDTSPANNESPRQFRTLPVLERNAILSDIRRRPLREIFDLWQRAGAVEKDLMKQGAIATTMAYALREQSPSQDLLDDMWQYVFDSRNSARERGGVLGIFGGAKTAEGLEFLLRAYKELKNTQLCKVALDQIAGMGDLRGDGSYHEEMSPPLERVWRGPADPDLLSRSASAMAKIGAPSGITMLLNSALDDNPANSERKRAALFGLEQVYSRNATPPVAGLLVSQIGANEASALATMILVNIGDEAAARALSDWFQNADASAVKLAENAVSRTRTPVLLDAWKTLLESNRVFRSDEIRITIRDSLERYYKGISSEK